jgi:phosphoglycolate phosphatase-like HAD superfamily hydrolase
LAIKKLGAQPENSIMVGDTVNDILSARAAGLKTIVIKSPFGKDNLASYHPDHILDNITGLKAVFGL